MASRSQFKTNEEYNKWHRDYRARNREKMRKYNREYNREWRKKNGYESQYAWNKRNPEKMKAHRIASTGLSTGFIEKKPCKVCGDKKVDMHHEDYTKPLDVVFLCRVHHTEVHRK